MTTIELTNGAAHWGLALLNETKCNLADLFASGSLANKLKDARVGPDARSGESPREYQDRLDAWFNTKRPVTEVTNDENDYMRKLIKTLGTENQLPGNIYVAELAIAFKLDQP